MDLEPIEERANEFATWVGKFDSANRIPAAFASAADVPALLAEVKRLRSICEDHALCADAISTLREQVPHLSTAGGARPAPAWDEVPDVAPGTREMPAWPDATESLPEPVKPSREDVYHAWHGTDDPWAGCADSASIERVLDLWPGESRAQVEAEALRDAVEKYAVTILDALGYKVPAVTTEDLLDRADRLAAEGGADRG